ncbi:MAG: YbjN domain-containing protein [Oscillospiraceae bacterium]|nr:YbjN domain-containing protein [Oscillospiraceae bacterium]
MIFRATEEIADRFESDGVDCEIEETENASILHLAIKLEYNEITIRFISTDDGADVAIRVFDLASFPEARMNAVLRAVNTLNRAYRFAAFSVDEEKNRVDVRADLPVNTADIAEAAYEMFLRMTSICNDAYPELMKAIWSA